MFCTYTFVPIFYVNFPRDVNVIDVTLSYLKLFMAKMVFYSYAVFFFASLVVLAKNG